ncbi:MAG TPA: LLM class flavin-dependent oxidoreductase [Candidatus Binatia bacterium]|nr:LLM class flavin-dependent oxidoreductase [Candidatus Binatia bacterium]
MFHVQRASLPRLWRARGQPGGASGGGGGAHLAHSSGSMHRILPLRHPLQSAEDYAMVDALSGGRLEFGIGSGNTLLFYQVFDIEREEGQERMEEALEIILNAWSSERFGHQGKFWAFPEVTLYPRPVQQPHPPIWVAGTSTRTLEWAGRKGYDIMTVGHPHPPEKMRPGVESWKKALIDQGIDPNERRCQFHTRTHVEENSGKARTWPWRRSPATTRFRESAANR